MPWKEYYGTVFKMQEQIVMAYRSKNPKRVKELQRILVNSEEGQFLAIRKVTTNQGSKTPGMDGTVWDTPAKRMEARYRLKEIINHPRAYKASPLKRVWIPKPGKPEKRPLGIPTLIDRAVQAAYLLAVDPVVEEESDLNSYGFRNFRSAHDAVVKVRTLLDKRTSPEWVLDADISKCFDRIDHDFLMENTTICDKTMLEQWLKSGIMEAGIYSDTTMGTPQGGVISPTLCNVALNGLERAAKESTRRSKNPKVNLTRYADDFVCTAANREILETEVKPALVNFLMGRGLELSEGKTRIANIHDGFDFLGFTFKREEWNPKLNAKTRRGNIQPTVLTVKPQRKKVQGLKEKIRLEFKKNSSLDRLIRDLNPLLRGWSEYFRISTNPTKLLVPMGHYVWLKMWNRIRKTHPRRRAIWLFEKYVTRVKGWNWSVASMEGSRLFNIAAVTRLSVPFLKLGINPYTEEGRRYYEKRRDDRKRILPPSTLAVYNRHNHNCSVCGESLHNGEPIELHHIVPRRWGGGWTLDNIQPLHKTCHASVTYWGSKQRPAE